MASEAVWELLREVRRQLGPEALTARGVAWLDGAEWVPACVDSDEPGLQPGIAFWQPRTGPLTAEDGDPELYRRGGRRPTQAERDDPHFRESVWSGPVAHAPVTEGVVGVPTEPYVQYDVVAFRAILEGFGTERYEDMGFLVELARGMSVRSMLTEGTGQVGRNSKEYMTEEVQQLDYEDLQGEVREGRAVGPFKVNPFEGGMVAGNLAVVKDVTGWRICRDITSSGVNATI